MGVSKASLRGLSIDQRMKKMQEAAAKERKTLRVTPTSDAIRMVLSHPNGGGFGKEGSAEWPDDGFTLRRIEDGDVKVESAEQPPAEPEKKSRGASSGGGN
jgi:hypothetical protein